MSNLEVYDIHLTISLPPIRVSAEDLDDAVEKFYEELFANNNELFNIYYKRRLEDRQICYINSLPFGDYGVCIDDLLGEKDGQ